MTTDRRVVPAAWLRGALASPKALIVASNIALIGCGLLSSVLSARILAPAGRGQFVQWQSWITTVATLALIGLPQVIVTDPELPNRVGPWMVRRLLGPMIALAGLTGACALWFLGAPALATLGGLCMMVSTIVNAVQVSAAQRSGAMRREFNVLRLAPAVAGITAALVLAVVADRRTADWMLLTGALQLLVVIGPIVVSPRLQEVGRPQINSLHKAAWKVAPIAWISLLQYRADLLIVSVLLPHSQIAFYAIGVAAQSAVFAAGQAGGMHWFSRHHADSLVGAISGTLATVAALAIPISLAADWIVPQIYGQEFSPAILPVVILVMGSACVSLDYLFTHAAMKDNYSHVLVPIKMGGLALLCIAVATSAHVWGTAVSAATASVLSSGISALSIGALVFRRSRAHAS